MIIAVLFAYGRLRGGKICVIMKLKSSAKGRTESDLIKEDMQFDPAALCRKERYYGDDSGTD